jgi:CDP-glycerol glycerophosphotransferase (TagB/SpsB family)
MDNNEKNKNRTRKIWKDLDYIISYSKMYNTLMVACMGIDIDKFVITGMPRNDFLFKSKGKENLKKIFDVGNKKIVFFMPTFRKGYQGRNDGNKNFNNLFGFEKFNEEEFLKFLKLNNILFVAKIHPNEEKFFSKNIISKDNFHLLKNADLEKNNIDLYELMNGVDLLITDYSSIYFDYLLLDRPIIFTPIDLDYYIKSRGLLLEPYNFWTPGPKALTQKELQNEILHSLKKDEYIEERNKLKDAIHYYQDGESSRRVWNLIQKAIEEKR